MLRESGREEFIDNQHKCLKDSDLMIHFQGRLCVNSEEEEEECL
jgi:hypothetical protein